MARVESVVYTPHRAEFGPASIQWERVDGAKVIPDLPQIVWADRYPWREANLWLMSMAARRDSNLRTVQTKATALCAYARWLEDTKTEWWDFPARKENRCLVRYRAYLIEARENGHLAPSTVTQRMRVLVGFYRWLKYTGLISPAWPMWQERTVGIRLTDSFGFERTFNVRSTDVSIPNRRAPGERLEDGLLPLSPTDRQSALDFARVNASQELFLMLAVGFFTGMRLQTIADLRVRTLTNAVLEPNVPDLYRLAIGPQAIPPVATKFGVTGQAWIPKILLEELLRYAHSLRRLEREVKAATPDKDRIFLTRFGNPYAKREVDKSVAINVEMHAFRNRAVRAGLSFMSRFRFHQTRCTFATELATLAIQSGGSMHAVAIVKEALLHAHESTSLRYIKFVEKTPLKVEAANAFTRAFLGLSLQSKYE
ncbi:Tyr recombinase domain-containing protein [Cupriavidus oxalaticus]|uniref:site-specific integrase n=1 Tax=Cupriavidus oxalaticus TaxID=96344 RepID=UPI003F7325B6